MIQVQHSQKLREPIIASNLIFSCFSGFYLTPILSPKTSARVKYFTGLSSSKQGAPVPYSCGRKEINVTDFHPCAEENFLSIFLASLSHNTEVFVSPF